MDHELARQLKDAGFPQKEPNGFVGLMNPGEGDGNGRAYFPTLEELIEACGEKFLSLNNYGIRGWHVVGKDKHRDEIEITEPFAIVAVARLWLALHANGDASA
jgi:hypothetical protein